MTSLTLLRKSSNCGRLNLTGIVPNKLLSLTSAEMETLPIESEHGSTPLASQFTVCDGDRDRLVFDGDLSLCDHVAGGLLSGDVHVLGPVGNFLASGMQGGRVVVTGSAGNYACSSLRGGQVTIDGDVGRYAAAAAPGASRGMAGGELLIRGSADEFLASRMRRGRVIVHGTISAGCASRMIAGTIVACSTVAMPLGYGMARGTILLLAPAPQQLATGLAGFTLPEPCELSFLTLLLKEVAAHIPVPQQRELANKPWLRSLGDRAEQGQGEIFFRQSQSPPSPSLEPWLR